MKRFLLLTAAFTSMLFASCSKEETAPANETTVTYTVEIPSVQVKGGTKAIGDGLNANKLIYEVWKTDGAKVTDLLNTNSVRLFQKEATMVQSGDHMRTVITLNLVQDQEYTLLFWAQDSESDAYVTEQLTNVTYSKDLLKGEYKSNDESMAAFYGVDFVSDSDPKSKTVYLKRPFAQLNIGTLNTADDYSVTMNTSEVVIEDVPTSFNVALKKAGSETSSFVFAHNNVPSNPDFITVKDVDYEYAAMNYIFAAAEGQTATVRYAIDATLTAAGENGAESNAIVTNVVENVPLMENYRTNIVGNLLTSTTEYEVIVDADWAGEDINRILIQDVDGLQQAIDEAEAGEEIFVNKDIVIVADRDKTKSSVAPCNAIVIPEGKEIVLNLGGYTISWESAVAGDVMFMNNGKLTLAGEGKITYKYTGAADPSYGKGNYTFFNKGELTLDGPTVENTTDAMSHACYAIHTDAATLNVVSGNVININGHAIRMAPYASGKVMVNINGGKIEGTRAIQMQLPSSNPSSAPEMELSVNGGVLKSNDPTYTLAIYLFSNGQSAENVKIGINGGTLYGNVALNEASTKTMSANSVRLNGGVVTGTYGVYSYAADAVAAPVIFHNGTEINSLYSLVYADSEEEVYTLAAGCKVAVDADETITVPAGKTLNLNINDALIMGASDVNTSNRNMFDVRGTMNVMNGSITLSHEGENMGWNCSTNIFNVTAGGVLNVSNCTLENKGGSDMGFVAHLNNWGEVTLNVENSTLKSNYVAVRVFNSGNDMNNVTIKGSTLEGANYAFWVHNYTVEDFGTQDKADAHKALLNLSIYGNGNTFVSAKAAVRYGFTNSLLFDAEGNEIVNN